MRQVVREFSFKLLRPNEHRCFEAIAATVMVCAEGALCEQEGALAALAALSRPFEAWLDKNWHRRWLISTDTELSYARLHDVRVAWCPVATIEEALAEYLLVTVFEQLMRETGLIVRAVSLQLEGQQAVTASLDDCCVDAYERDQGIEPDGAPRVPPFCQQAKVFAFGSGRHKDASQQPGS